MEEQYTKEMFRLAESLCVKYNALCKRGKDPHGNDVCRIYTTNNNFAGSLKISMWREEVRFCYFSMFAGECCFKINPNTFEEDVDYAIRFLIK